MIKVHKSQRISVIVPVFNGGDKFRRCLDSLESCTPSPAEIIVVADGESDGSWKYAQQKGYTTILIETTGGPAKARNKGAMKATGDIILFIDADVTVSKDIIERVSDFFNSHINTAAIIGSYDDTPFEKDHLSQYRNLLHHFTHQCADTNASTFWGACGAIRRGVFISSGGFNESYTRPCIEDIELGYRLKERGLTLHLLKDLQIKHLKKWEFVSMLKTDILNRAIPWTELLISRKNNEYDLNLSLSNRVSTLLVFLLPIFIITWIFNGVSYFISSVIILLFVLNWKFYLFLLNKRGLLFLLKSLPFHWLYFFSSGLSYAYVSFKFAFNKLRLALRRQHMSL